VSQIPIVSCIHTSTKGAGEVTGMPFIVLRIFQFACTHLSATLEAATLDPKTCHRPQGSGAEHVYTQGKSHSYQYSMSYRQRKEQKNNRENLHHAEPRWMHPCIMLPMLAAVSCPTSPARTQPKFTIRNNDASRSSLRQFHSSSFGTLRYLPSTSMIAT
jgi:hypothetical protein